MNTEETNARIDAVIAELGLSVSAVFIPWSQSRNKGEKTRSLNWTVTLKRQDREILSTDYMAGIAHCPSYQRSMTIDVAEAVQREYEHGKKYRRASSILGDPILPDTRSVINSLVLDAEAIDHATYEDFADTFGYDKDSRKGEAIYRACLEIGLKLRAGIGDAGIQKLREAFQDY